MILPSAGFGMPTTAVCLDHAGAAWAAPARVTWVEARLDEMRHEYEVHGVVPARYREIEQGTPWPEELAHIQ